MAYLNDSSAFSIPFEGFSVPLSRLGSEDSSGQRSTGTWQFAPAGIVKIPARVLNFDPVIEQVCRAMNAKYEESPK
jgi:hypothetical protein